MIGNLNEDGYLIASDEELLGIVPAAAPEVDAAKSESVVQEAVALGLDSVDRWNERLTSACWPMKRLRLWILALGASNGKRILCGAGANFAVG